MNVHIFTMDEEVDEDENHRGVEELDQVDSRLDDLFEFSDV